MIELNPKALKAAGEVYLSEQVEMQAPGQIDWATSELSSAIKAYIEHPDADLVPGVKYDELSDHHRAALRKGAKAEYDTGEARREADNYADRLVIERARADNRGKQLVALREAGLAVIVETKFSVRPANGEPIVEIINKHGPAHRRLCAVLTDTDKAAAQYKLIDDEHVVMPVEPTNRILEYFYGPFISASTHASRIEAYKNAMQLMPKPKSGEGTK